MKTKQALNPYMPSWEYVPDAEPHVVGDRVYVYGSHDIFNGLNFCLGDYVCWSAPVDDLGNWHYEGCIYKREQGSGSTENPSDKWPCSAGYGAGTGWKILFVLFHGWYKDDLRSCM